MSTLATALADLATKAQAKMSRSRLQTGEYESASDASSLSEDSTRSPSTRRFHLAPLLTLRPNEHLAVLLPKNLWKPDALASTCDNFSCRVPFSLLERRHHCRKCGGVFCQQCTSRITHLLDVSNLDFLFPPRNTPIATFDSPTSPVVVEKVCDDCWDQIHGLSRTPDSRPSTPMLVSSPSTSSSPSPTSSICASPVELQSSLPSAAVSVTRSSSQSSARKLPFPSVQTSIILDLEPTPQPSFGELDAYPLRQSSIICKATGGGRWEPKNSPPRVGVRVPGCKAQYELEIEKEEQEERRIRLNPIIRDGDFQYRFKPDRSIVSTSLARSPRRLSTF
ncbi:FYVE zinc finger-domain-containing protein [Pisolithus croceorrhizus]|nr:FYVE zinc finger-domain-containing protein [Pisolithus croceorrhizus]KAI6133889.1 FYVE zinc finger-domain-containing protein [Pisolithus croceorrhizus]